jgi:hypothetical protein
VDDDDAVVDRERVVHGLRELDPVMRLHVARVEVEEDARLDLGDLPEHGQLSQEITRVHVGGEWGVAVAVHHQRPARVKEQESHGYRA